MFESSCGDHHGRVQLGSNPYPSPLFPLRLGHTEPFVGGGRGGGSVRACVVRMPFRQGRNASGVRVLEKLMLGTAAGPSGKCWHYDRSGLSVWSTGTSNIWAAYGSIEITHADGCSRIGSFIAIMSGTVAHPKRPEETLRLPSWQPFLLA